MTRRRTLERHRHSLAEIQGIMNSMKSLAYLETRKLTRFLDAFGQPFHVSEPEHLSEQHVAGTAAGDAVVIFHSRGVVRTHRTVKTNLIIGFHRFVHVDAPFRVIVEDLLETAWRLHRTLHVSKMDEVDLLLLTEVPYRRSCQFWGFFPYVSGSIPSRII